MMPRTRRDDRGLAAVWVVVVGTAILAFVALVVVDGGTVLRTRSRAFSIAGEAARAGAQALDDTAAVHGDVRIEPAAARAAAARYLSDQAVTGTVTITGDEVTVTVHDTADLDFYPVDVAVTATATALAMQPPRRPEP